MNTVPIGKNKTTRKAKKRGWQAQGRPKLLQLIHVGATRLGLIDAALPAGDPERDQDYRRLLIELTGRNSCQDLNDAQLQLVLRELQDRGFVIEAPANVGRRPRNMAPGDMRTKVEALLADQGLPWAYAEAILRQQRGLPKGIACPVSTASAIELRGLIAALDRRAKKGAGASRPGVAGG